MYRFLATSSAAAMALMALLSKLEPNSIFMLFASGTLQMNILRLAIIALLIMYISLPSLLPLYAKNLANLLNTIVMIYAAIAIHSYTSIGLLDMMCLALYIVTISIVNLEMVTYGQSLALKTKNFLSGIFIPVYISTIHRHQHHSKH